MNRVLLIFLFALLPSLSFCQVFINQTKPDIERAFKHGLAHFDDNGNIRSETDSTFVLQYRGAKALPVDFIFHFDVIGKCISQKILFNCDSCYKYWVNKTIDLRRYQWKQISADKYLSKYSKQMMLTKNDAEHAYTINKMNLDQRQYDQLLVSFDKMNK